MSSCVKKTENQRKTEVSAGWEEQAKGRWEVFPKRGAPGKKNYPYGGCLEGRSMQRLHQKAFRTQKGKYRYGGYLKRNPTIFYAKLKIVGFRYAYERSILPR